MKQFLYFVHEENKNEKFAQKCKDYLVLLIFLINSYINITI